MPFSRISGVIVIALLGLVIAAAITYAASTLVSQPIGLTSEPATLGKGLAPSAETGTPRPRTVTITTTTPTSTTPTSTTPTGTTPVPGTPTGTTPTAGGDDHGGRVDGDGDDD